VPVLSSPRIRLRPRETADDEFIQRLGELAFGEYSRDAKHSTLPMARSGQTWIAERGGAPVGFAIARDSGEACMELCAIAVEEHARGVGVGATLLAHVERELARAGTLVLTLHTAEANASALELFVKCGFRSDRRLPRYYRGVYDAWQMHKRIAE
jgi:ribosomal protein S18 acetylase RimI-like enzyme